MENHIDFLLESPDAIEDIVGIMYWGRSGSYLLSSLFDCHSETLQLPLGNWSHHYTKFDEYANALRISAVDNVINLMLKDLSFITKEWNQQNPLGNVNLKSSMIAMLGESKNEACGCPVEKLKYYLNNSLEKMQQTGSFDGNTIFKALHIA